MKLKEIEEILRNCDYVLDYSQWDVEGKLWARFKSLNYDIPKTRIVIYKKDTVADIIYEVYNKSYELGKGKYQNSIKEVLGL